MAGINHPNPLSIKNQHPSGETFVFSHETANTVIAGAALLISSLTAWFQFAPEADTVQIVSQERVRTKDPIHLKKFPIPLPDRKLKTLALDPVTWRVIVFNPTSHGVPITGIEVVYDHSDGVIKSTSMLKRLVVEGSAQTVALPMMLAPHEAKAFLVSLQIPVVAPSRNDVNCTKKTRSVDDFESCYFRHGHDLFGNEGTSLNGAGFMWKDKIAAPIHRLTFKTAGKAQVMTNLTMLPAL